MSSFYEASQQNIATETQWYTHTSHSPRAPLTLEFPVTENPTSKLFSLPSSFPCDRLRKSSSVEAGGERGVLTMTFLRSTFRSEYKALRVCRTNTADDRYSGRPVSRCSVASLARTSIINLLHEELPEMGQEVPQGEYTRALSWNCISLQRPRCRSPDNPVGSH